MPPSLVHMILCFALILKEFNKRLSTKLSKNMILPIDKIAFANSGKQKRAGLSQLARGPILCSQGELSTGKLMIS